MTRRASFSVTHVFYTRLLIALLCTLASFGISTTLRAQTPNAPAAVAQATPTPPSDALVRAKYTKMERLVPMRDGVKLFTSIYVPKDAGQAGKTYPVMYNRTPYSVAPYGEDKFKTSLGPSPVFGEQGFIFVYQDVRGRLMSEGEFVDVRPHNERKTGTQIDENTDAYDTIEWILKNVKGNNGRVGIWGISYPGFYTSTSIIDSHPAIKAASPQAPIADWFIGDDFHHNGAFFYPHAFNFLASFGQPRTAPGLTPPLPFLHGTPDGYKFFLNAGSLQSANDKYFKNNIKFWNEMIQHPNYDEFWQARNILPRLKNIHTAVMTVGGWFDSEDLYGALKTYEAIERQNPNITNTLVMGPWEHGGWSRTDGDALGNLRFGAKTAEFYRKEIELAFFNFYLKDKGTNALPEAYVFDTGRNEWRKFDKYPVPAATERSIYLQPNGKLSFDQPTVTATSNTASMNVAYDEYVSDPNRPVPHIPDINIGMKRGYMVEDQRLVSRRPDVLSYQTEPLTEDMTITGAITPGIFVSTSGTDADYIVKLIDVYPDTEPVNPDTKYPMAGFQMLVRGEPFRARFRNSFSKPEAMTPNEATRVEYVMPDALHTFKKGHRIMVQIQSTWFPLIDRNPQTFVPNISQARDADYKAATMRVFHQPDKASRVKLFVLPTR